MFFLIGDAIFIILGIPALLRLYSWKRSIEDATRNNSDSSDDLYRSLRICKQIIFCIIVLIIFGCINLVSKVI